MPTKKQPKVSILVPCYNVEKYLPECLNSIVNQTLKDIEIICINDGSTDTTLDIIKGYVKKDKRIVIIDKPNEGYGKSMNRGLDAATGEYVGIVESDDWVEPDAFETLYDTAKKNKADMVKADFVFFDNDTRVGTPCWSIGIADELKEKVFCPTEQNPGIIWTGHPSIWTCLYSNKMIQDKNIRFAETPGAAFQDMGFKPKTFIASKRFYYLPKVVLHYRKHANNSDKNNGKVFAVCDAHDDTDKWLVQNIPNWKNYIKIANQCRFYNYRWNLGRLYGEAQQQFKQCFSLDFREIFESGNINKNYFDNKTWWWLKRLCYPKSLYCKFVYAFNNIIRPIYKTIIRDGYKMAYIFNILNIYKHVLPGVTND